MFEKKFAAQVTIDLNISKPSNFFGNYFMVSPINFKFLIQRLLVEVFQGIAEVFRSISQ